MSAVQWFDSDSDEEESSPHRPAGVPVSTGWTESKPVPRRTVQAADFDDKTTTSHYIIDRPTPAQQINQMQNNSSHNIIGRKTSPKPTQPKPAIQHKSHDVTTKPKPSIENKGSQKEKIDRDFYSSLSFVIFLAYLVDEVFLSGNMPDFKTYIKYQLSQMLLSIEKTNSKTKKIMHFIKGLPFAVLYFLDIILRGVSQVYLCNHPISGLCICIGLWTTSSDLLVFALCGSICSTLAASIVCTPKIEELEAGLCGYDGVLAANAIYTFISLRNDEYVAPEMDTRALFLACVLAAASGIVHIACVNMNQMPALTLSFNIIIMGFLLAVARQKTNVATISWLVQSDDGLDDDGTDAVDEEHMTFYFFFDAVFRGVGQFIFINTTSGGILVVVGIAISTRYSALALLLGSFIGCINARYILRVARPSWGAVRDGLYGFNPAGISAAITGDIFFHVNAGSLLLASVGSLLVGLVSLALASVLDSDDVGVPVLTLPFCVTTWLILLTRTQHLQPKTTEEGADLDDLLYKNASREDRFFEDNSIVPKYMGSMDGEDDNGEEDNDGVSSIKTSRSPKTIMIGKVSNAPTQDGSSESSPGKFVVHEKGGIVRLPLEKGSSARLLLERGGSVRNMKKENSSSGLWNQRSPRQSMVQALKESNAPKYRRTPSQKKIHLIE